jgi:hypothetical protein
MIARRWRQLPLAVAALVLAACGTVELAAPPAQPPIFTRIDARVGVSYAGDARSAVLSNPLLRIEIGKASVDHLDRAFAGMFAETVALPDWPPWREGVRGVDAVIELERLSAELLVGDDTGAKPDVVSIAYRICLHEATGTEVVCWNAAARHTYARHFGECLDLRACIAPQVERTMRAAIAQFMVAAERDASLQAWAAALARRKAAP